jgi:hypothetical protein
MIIKFFRKIFKKLSKIIWLVFKRIKDELLNIEFTTSNNFSLNHILNLVIFYMLYFGKESFYKWYLEQWSFNQNTVNYIYYVFLYFYILIVFYSWYLIYYRYYLKRKEKYLKKAWYIKLIEDEYKIWYESFLKWLGFFITMLVSFTAIYLSIISMQTSLDIANSTITWKIDISNTLKMFKSLWEWIWITTCLFITCFFYYRWNIISKNNYVKDLYYSSYNYKK